MQESWYRDPGVEDDEREVAEVSILKGCDVTKAPKKYIVTSSKTSGIKNELEKTGRG